MNQTFKSLIAIAALGIGLSAMPVAHAQKIKFQPSIDPKSVDIAVCEVRVLAPTGPVTNNAKVPKGTKLQVMATLVNLGSAPTPGCKVRMTNTGDPNIQTALVPSLPAGGSCSVSFPTATMANGATTLTWQNFPNLAQYPTTTLTNGATKTPIITVEANFDAGLSPYGRWFPESSYSNNLCTVTYFLI